MFDLQNPQARTDVHSYARPDEWVNKYVYLELDVDFGRKVLAGTATLHVDRAPGKAAEEIVLDTRDLMVRKAEFATNEGETNWQETPFRLGKSDAVLGAPLYVKVPPETRAVRISYETSPGAVALQWLEPAQTAGKKHPFLFSQSQAIQARSWIPIQDSPGIRVEYGARIRVPKALTAVMSARTEEDREEEEAASAATAGETREFRFFQNRRIPPYLIALAVGELAFENLDPEERAKAEEDAKRRNRDEDEDRPRRYGRTGVYAEPSVLGAATSEFEDTEKMIRATEKLYGRYRWGRYDLLILPPSFPFGGMENPMLTFATPTVIAGDKSLVSLVAHELAHSWSGNLVTNATWRDFWLNEGFTVYLERRILEALYGKERAEMEAVLGYQTLMDEMKSLPEKDQILYVDLTGRDPDEGFTNVPYEKGALFLSTIEAEVGRERFDEFLRSYFNHYEFQSITTQDFLNYLDAIFFKTNPTLAEKIPVMEWLTKPGIPAGAAIPKSAMLSRVNTEAERFAKGEASAEQVPFKGWSSLEQLSFLRALPKDLGAARMAALDGAFNITASGNAEVVSEWLLMAIRNNYEAANPRLERFLVEVGRRKFLKPLYEELVKTEAGRERARKVYTQARGGYHPMAVATVDGIVKP